MVILTLPAAVAPTPHSPRGTLLGVLVAKAEDGTKIPCRFTVTPPTWFTIDGDRLVSNWDPTATWPAHGGINPGAHAVAITATPIELSDSASFTIVIP